MTTRTEDDVSSVTFSADGALLAAGVGRGQIKIWHWQDETLLATLIVNEDETVTDLAFAPDGQSLASVWSGWSYSEGDYSVVRWSRFSDKALLEEGKGSAPIYFSLDSQTLGSTVKWNEFQTWQLTDGQIVKQSFMAAGDQIIGMSADNAQMASIELAESDLVNDVIIWSSTDQVIVNHLTISEVSFGYSGYNHAYCNIMGPDGGPDWLIEKAIFAPDKTVIALNLAYSSPRIYRVADGRLMSTLQNAQYLTDFAPNGSTFLAKLNIGTMGLFDTQTGALVNHFSGFTDRYGEISFFPDGQLVAASGSDGYVRVWRVSDGARLYTLHGQSASVAFSPDGQWLASGLPDGRIGLWRLSDGVLVQTLTGHLGQVNGLAFSWDSQQLVTGSRDCTVRVWRVSDGLQLKLLPTQGDIVRKVAYLPRSDAIAIGLGFSEAVLLWRVTDDEPFKQLVEFSNFGDFAFSADGKVFAGGDWDKVNIQNIVSDELRTLKIPGTHANHLAFSPDGSLLAFADDDESIQIWDVYQGALTHTFYANPDSLSFSPDGRLLAITVGGAIRLWGVRP